MPKNCKCQNCSNKITQLLFDGTDEIVDCKIGSKDFKRGLCPIDYNLICPPNDVCTDEMNDWDILKVIEKDNEDPYVKELIERFMAVSTDASYWKSKYYAIWPTNSGFWAKWEYLTNEQKDFVYQKWNIESPQLYVYAIGESGVIVDRKKITERLNELDGI